MGAYIYGVLAKSVKADGLTVHLCKYICKPWASEPRWSSLHAARMARIHAYWQDKERARLVVVGDEFKDGAAIHDLTGRKNWRDGSPLPIPTVFYDDPEGFGNVVGWLRRQGRSWTVVKTHTSEWVGSRGTEGDGMETGRFRQSEWVDETGHHTETTLIQPMTHDEAFHPNRAAVGA